MIDTIVVKSPAISYDVAYKIEQFAYKKVGVEVSTGEIFYCITTAELKGSYDYVIRIKIEYEDFVSFYDSFGKVITEKRPCKPYVIVECSLNKLIMGHNIYGGSDDFRQFELLINFLQKEINICLPSWKDWVLKRLDYAEIFAIGEQNVYNYIRNLSNCSFSRRKTLRFGDTGFYVPGTTTTLKFYAKGKEFKKHDKKRLLHDSTYKIDDIHVLQRVANGLLRIECEIKSKKIRYDHDDKLLTLAEYENASYFENIYNREVQKVIKIVDNDVKYYNKFDDVQSVLYDKFSSMKASSLLGTWLKLSLVGEEKAKLGMSKSTFYRHRKQLIDCRCMWNNSIVEKNIDNIIDFVPYTNSKYVYKFFSDYALKKLNKLYEIYDVC